MFTACDSSMRKIYEDTSVEARVVHGQPADGDGVVLQRSICLNPVLVSLSRGDVVRCSSTRVIVLHLFLLLVILIQIQIHPFILVIAVTVGTPCNGTPQGDILARRSPHCVVVCRKEEEMSQKQYRSESRM